MNTCGVRIATLFLFVNAIFSEATGAPALTLPDLPLHPETVCASEAVKSALTTCIAQGPSSMCCQGLDGVFADGSSPSRGCLCFPKALYQVIVDSSKHGRDALALLQACKANSTAAAPFNTQWSADDNTGCPHIPLDARMEDSLPDFGDAILVPSSRSRGTWAWANMLQSGDAMQELPNVQAVADKLFGAKHLQLLYVMAISMPPIFFILHHGPLMHCSSVYRQLSAADKLVSCQHAVYALVFGLSLVPQTALAFKSLFFAWTGTYVASPELSTLVGIFIPSRAVLYVGEAAVRSVVKWSWLLVVHHLLFFATVTLAVWSRNAAVAGMGIVLDLFACHEAPLYIALLAYRLQWPLQASRNILRGACVWYVLTRIFQTIVLLYMIVGFGGMAAVRFTYEFIIVSILCAAFTFVQAYTILIYKAIDVKLGQKLAAVAAASKANGCSGQGRPCVEALASGGSSGSEDGSHCLLPGDVAITVVGQSVSGCAENAHPLGPAGNQ